VLPDPVPLLSSSLLQDENATAATARRVRIFFMVFVGILQDESAKVGKTY
jgi:hypothetical protein